MVDLCLWVNNSKATITHSFQGKAASSTSQFPQTSLSWLIKLGLLTASHFSRDSLPLPLIFNIIPAFFSGRRLSLLFVLGWLTSTFDLLRQSFPRHWARETQQGSRQNLHFFLLHTEALRSINTKPLASSMTFCNTLGRGNDTAGH